MVDEYSETEIPESTQPSQTLELTAYSTHQKSVVWKYYGIEKSSSGAAQRDRWVTCKLCAQKVAHGSGATNLRNHLKMNHRVEFEELYGNETNQTSIDSFVQRSPSSVKSYRTIRHVQWN